MSAVFKCQPIKVICVEGDDDFPKLGESYTILTFDSLGYVGVKEDPNHTEFGTSWHGSRFEQIREKAPAPPAAWDVF